MKITINANITPETINTYLDKQYQKKEKIIQFCKDKKISELQYKDSELEFEYQNADISKNVEKQFTNPKPKIETRGGAKNAKD